jgi:hypothetical protein
MNVSIRRASVTAGVIVSILAGAAAIQLAAMYAAAAAPPKAPPVSLDSLRSQLTAEQQRSAALQGQLDELTALTGQLSDLLDSTKTEISSDGLTAAQLRSRLAGAQSKLAAVSQQLKAAQARLDQLNKAFADAGKQPPPPPPPAAGGGGGGAPPPAATGMTLALSRSGGVVNVDWSSCSASSFAGYAVVRSTDSEIHWPPEDHDTEIARITNRATTAYSDGGAPSGTLTYQVYCLSTQGGDTQSVAHTPARGISVP